MLSIFWTAAAISSRLIFLAEEHIAILSFGFKKAGIVFKVFSFGLFIAKKAVRFLSTLGVYTMSA